MSCYNTEQKKLLTEFLMENKDRNFTIEEIMENLQRLCDDGKPMPGLSTVYRLIAHLIDEGKVKKFVKQGSRKALYQYVITDHCESHLHLKCTECGKIFHMDEVTSKKVLSEINLSNDFSVSQGETILYGKCSECRKK